MWSAQACLRFVYRRKLRSGKRRRAMLATALQTIINHMKRLFAACQTHSTAEMPVLVIGY
jgi:hypothetical protein